VIIHPLRSSLVSPGDSLFEAFVEALQRNRIQLKSGDIVAVSSKIVATSEKALVDSTDVPTTAEARALSRAHSLPPSFVQVVMDEADLVVGGVRGALLTVKDGDATANAGVDRKNAPEGTYILWPRNADISAKKFRLAVQKKLQKRVGVVIVDSRVTPLRLGTIGFAIGTSGFRPVEDVRGEFDLSGRRIEITRRAVADGLAASAQLVMGEASEKKPFAIIRSGPVKLNSNGGIRPAKLAPEQCLYMSQILTVH